MTTKIDAERLRAERKKRAWTQEHLAQVTNLGLRTIQRIESTGSASPDSVQALACCLEMSASDLITDSLAGREPAKPRFRLRPALTAVVLSTLVLFSFSATRVAVADDITLSFTAVVTAQEDSFEHIGEMSIEDGEESQFQMNGVFKVLVSPRDLGNSQVLLSLRIFAIEDGMFSLVSEPSLITASGKEAVFSLGLNDDRGSTIRVAVTPDL